MSSRQFVIITSGRTASNLLVRLLRSHTDIYCNDEIFNSKIIKFKFDEKSKVVPHLDRVMQEMEGLAPVTGYKNRTCDPWIGTYASFKQLWDYFVDNQFYIIHNIRRNLFDVYLSYLLADLELNYDDNPYESKIFISINDMVRKIDELYAEHMEVYDYFSTRCEYIPVTYNQVVKHDLDSAIRFLGLEPHLLHDPKMGRRQMRRLRWDYIKNADEVKAFLALNKLPELT